MPVMRIDKNSSIKKVFSLGISTDFVQSRFDPLSSSSLYIFFPVSIAGLQHTFPSRTRSLRGLATMILHSRVWESSSMPDFFLPARFLQVGLFFAFNAADSGVRSGTESTDVYGGILRFLFEYS